MLKQKSVFDRGFTIVELLIVIVVIGILAALVLISFADAQDKAKLTKVASDIAVIEKASRAARINADKTLYEITGNSCTRCSCPYTSGDMTVYSTLPKTHACWVRYYDFLNSVGTAAGTNLDQLREGDPWGSPYAIDENEMPGGCSDDHIRSYGKSGTNNGGTHINIVVIPNYQAICL